MRNPAAVNPVMYTRMLCMECRWENSKLRSNRASKSTNEESDGHFARIFLSDFDVLLGEYFIRNAFGAHAREEYQERS